MEEATDGKWKEEKEKVSINLSRVEIWYGHVRDDEDIHPCRLKPSFAPFVLEREVGNEAGNRGTHDGGGGGSGGNGVWLVLLFVACLISLLSRMAKAAVLGGVDSPGHVVVAPMVSLALGGLLLGLTVLGGRLLPCLFLLLVLLVKCVLLVFGFCVTPFLCVFLTEVLLFLGKLRSEFELALELGNQSNESLLFR